MTDAAVVKHEPCNPCCELWKAKVSKLEEKITGMKTRRGFLVDGIRMYEKNLPLVEAENRKLLKENEEERKRSDDEREEKLKEVAKRVSLEGDISVLRSEIASLKESGSGGSEDFGEEVVRLRESVAEGEQEINRLRDCLEKEKVRQDFSEEIICLRASVAKGEHEINRLRDCLEKEKAREYFDEEVVLHRASVAEGEQEINRLWDCLEKEKAGEDSGEEVLRLRASVAEGEQEINRLKDCLQKEKAQADSQTKKAVAERKIVEAERKKTKVELKKAEVERKKIEAEMKKTKAELKKAESERKAVEAELKKTSEALITAKEEKDRNGKQQEDNYKEMNVKDSAFRVSLENEISALKSQITPLQQKNEDMEKEVTFLQGQVNERESEINRVNEILHKEEEKADFEKKIYDGEIIKAAAEICRVEKLYSDNEREEKAKKQALQDALESEISDLKSQIVVLQQKAGTDAQDAENIASFLKASVSDKETEINLLKELLDSEKTRADFEKRRADEKKKKADEISDKMQEAGTSTAVEVLADLEKEEERKDFGVRLSLENEISCLQSQILMLQQNLGVRDVDKEVSVLQECVSAGEAGISQLKELLEEERARTEFEKKKFEAEQKRDYEAWEIVSAEKVRADEVSKLASFEQKKAKEVKLELERLSVEVVNLRSKLASETLKLQQTKDALEIERQKTIKEKRRADLEMAKAEEQKKLTEINRRRVEEEKFRADCLSQQLDDGKRRLEKMQETPKYISSTKSVESFANLYVKNMNLETATPKGRPQLENKKIESGEPKLVLHCLKCEEVNQKLKDVTLKANREKKRADSEMRKAEERKKVFEANEQKVLEEKNRTGLLVQELQDKGREIEELKKEMQEHVPSRALVDPLASKYINVESEERKLLKKKLKLAKLQVKHAKEVVSFEKGRNFLLQQQLSRLKDDFSQVSDHLDMLDKCFSYCDNSHDSDRRKLHLKRKFLEEEPYEMHLQSGSELLKHNCTDSDYSDPSKHCVKCNASLLHISKRNCTESISGIDSKLETLLRCSKRTMLKSPSAINSSTEIFSDRQLMGLQEGGASSVVELNKLIEGKANLQPIISGKSDDVMKSIPGKNTAVVAENSVRSPLRIDAVGEKVGHSKKRKRVDNIVVSIKDLNCGGKKHLQIAEKLSTLQAMLKNHTDKCSGEGKYLLPDLQDSDRIVRNVGGEDEVVLQQLHISNGKKGKLGIDSIREISTCQSDSDPVNNVTRTPVYSGRIGYTSGEDLNFFKVTDEDYLKLLELDSALDEGIYRLAIERPLSPTLPEVGVQMDKLKSLVVGCDSGVLLVQNDNPSRTSHENECVGDFCKLLESNEECKSQTTHSGDSSVSKLWDLNKLSLFGAGNKEIDILLDSYRGSVRDDISLFCVVSSDNNDSRSISKIFFATKTCLTRCSFTSQTDGVVQKTLVALLEVENLLPKEKVCVFLSLLLQKFPWFNLENFKDVRDEGLIHLFDSFSGYMRSVMDNIETRRMFEELLDLDEVLNVIEDFLIDGRVLVHCDVSSQALPAVDSTASVVLSGGNLISFQVVSAQQLLSAAIVLASICAAVDHIDFVCEASYNILKMQKIDSSVLTVLHVFAYISGANYFTNSNYSLLMTVVKSLVTFMENAPLSTSSTSYCQTSIKSHLGFSPCNECPFSEDVISMDLVVSLLMEKLGNYALSDITYEDLVDSIAFLNSKSLDSKKLTKPWPSEREIRCVKCSNTNASLCLHKTQKSSSPETDPDDTLSSLGDVLSLCELVSLNMSWNWTFNNIVFQLLKMLDTCVVENSLTAIVILIGQLGRLGVDANGYDGTSVEKLRAGLSGFLCRSASSNMGLPIQIATVTALLGVISLSFEELINTNIDLPEVSGSSPNCIGKWFSSLSNEQQSLSLRLLIV